MEEQYKGTLYLNMSHDEYKKDKEEQQSRIETLESKMEALLALA